MDKGDPLVLPQGTHVYNFECKLPPELPSSFEGKSPACSKSNLQFVQTELQQTIEVCECGKSAGWDLFPSAEGTTVKYHIYMYSLLEPVS